jgi:hypothetical protein
MKNIIAFIFAALLGASAYAQPQVQVNLLATNQYGGPGGFMVTSNGIAFSGTVTGLTNNTAMFIGQFTNGTANTALALATYYTNTFGRKVQADFTLSVSNAINVSGGLAIYGYTSTGVARPPYFVGEAGTNLVTNTIPYQIDSGGYFAITNLSGSWTLLTNDVVAP